PATGRQLVDTLKVLNDETAIPQLGPKTGDGLGTGPASLGPAPAADDPLVRVPAPQGPRRPGSALDQLREVTYPDAVCWIGARLAKRRAEREGAPPRLRPLNPAVSSGLEAIVRKCLEPDPARRYQSAGDLRDDLDRHRADLPLSHVRVPSVRERVRKWARRHP